MVKKQTIKNYTEWMNTKRITPAQFVTVIFAIFLFVAFETASFRAWGDFAKTTVYIILVAGSALLGFKAVDVKKFALAAKGIIIDGSLDNWTKIQRIFNLIVPMLIEVNEEFDALNILQDTKPSDIEEPIIKESIVYPGTVDYDNYKPDESTSGRE